MGFILAVYSSHKGKATAGPTLKTNKIKSVLMKTEEKTRKLRFWPHYFVNFEVTNSVNCAEEALCRLSLRGVKPVQ